MWVRAAAYSSTLVLIYMPETQTKKDSKASTSSPEMNAQSNDVPMSHVEARPHPDSGDEENSQSGALGSPIAENHANVKTRLTFEKLVESLNLPTFPLPTPDKSSSDEDSYESLGALNHTSTGIALGKYQNYQAEGSETTSGNAQIAADTGNEEVSAAGNGQRTQSDAATAVSPPSAQSPASESDQQPQAASNTQPGIPRAIPNPYYSGIHYRRILLCVSIFTLAFQVLFALALGGVFGEWGYLLASVFLVVILVVCSVVVINGVRQRMWEIKMETTNT